MHIVEVACTKAPEDPNAVVPLHCRQKVAGGGGRAGLQQLSWAASERDSEGVVGGVLRARATHSEDGAVVDDSRKGADLQSVLLDEVPALL